MFAWNTLGLAYTKLEKPDSAFMAFDKALAIAQKGHKPFWISIITGNKGDVYFQQEKYDSAEVLLKFDYEGSLKAKEYDNAGNTLQWLARIDLIHHQPEEALKKTREAQRLISTSYDPDYMARTLFTYTKVFASLGKVDSVSYYLDQFLTLHDSIEQVASDARAEIIQQRMESQENIHKIKTLNKEKARIKLVRNFIVTIILMLALVGFMILNRQKLKLKVRRQEALEAKRIAEQDASLAKEQLNNFTRTLIEKTTLAETLQAQLMEKEISEEQSEHIAELTGHAILTDEDWDNFKSLFENVYPHFFQTLKKATEGITIAEQRMASLIKLKVPAKKAAIILGISPNSVYKTRQRLR
ncbi:MAG TPA: tetratricopeptide repeat protein, partial [Saprospiraceae bacterium]|nr:tetratricopeptide repeat protein [Saprospiraceae bacterium]